MTHTRYAFVRADRKADIISRRPDGFLQPIPVQLGAFDAPGAEVLARDRDRHKPAVMAGAGCPCINPIGTG